MANIAIPKIIKNGIFVIGAPIGKGSFGEVYHATRDNGDEVAIKFEARSAPKKYLENEIEVSCIILSLSTRDDRGRDDYRGRCMHLKIFGIVDEPEHVSIRSVNASNDLLT